MTEGTIKIVKYVYTGQSMGTLANAAVTMNTVAVGIAHGYSLSQSAETSRRRLISGAMAIRKITMAAKSDEATTVIHQKVLIASSVRKKKREKSKMGALID